MRLWHRKAALTDTMREIFELKLRHTDVLRSLDRTCAVSSQDYLGGNTGQNMLSHKKRGVTEIHFNQHDASTPEQSRRDLEWSHATSSDMLRRGFTPLRNQMRIMSGATM